MASLLRGLIISLALPGLLQASDWPQWRGPERNAQSDEVLASKDWTADPPKHLWTVEGFGEGYASVAVVGGVLYTLGDVDGGQSVIAASAEDGKILWKQPLTETRPEHKYEGSRCTPSVDGDRLYVVSSDGAVSCLKSATGEIVWQRKFSEWNDAPFSKAITLIVKRLDA